MAKSVSEIRSAFSELKEEVIANGNVQSVQMRDLRDRVGAGRLDNGPVLQIERALQNNDLDWNTSSNKQDHFVLVYVKDSQVGRILDAARGTEPDSDKTLLSAIQSFKGEASDPRDSELADLRDMLTQVQAIVGELPASTRK